MSAAVPAALATTTVLQLQQTSLSAPPSKCQAFGQGDPDAWIIQIFVAFLLWALVSNVKLGGFFNTRLTFAKDFGETASLDLKFIPRCGSRLIACLLMCESAILATP